MSKPKFRRQEIHHKKALKDAWRKPRGINSKLRIQKKSRGNVPKPGFGSPKEARGLESGLKPVMVANAGDMEKIGSEEIAIISHSVGKKKRLQLLELAESRHIKVSNAKY
jgi:large subunit ribosomal protein L32e